MSEETYIIIGGIYHIGFIIFHFFFWKIFKWDVTLRKLNSIDRSTIQVLNISLTFVFAFFAYLSINYSAELSSTKLGISTLLFISLFWFFRAIQQIYFYGLKNRLSILLFIIFLFGGIIYSYAFWGI
jgi:hypothetical protein